MTVSAKCNLTYETAKKKMERVTYVMCTLLFRPAHRLQWQKDLRSWPPDPCLYRCPCSGPHSGGRRVRWHRGHREYLWQTSSLLQPGCRKSAVHAVGVRWSWRRHANCRLRVRQHLITHGEGGHGRSELPCLGTVWHPSLTVVSWYRVTSLNNRHV